jgi:hypothetical protein
MIFKDAVMIAGNAEMPATSGTGTMVGNAGNGYARITRVHEEKVQIAGEITYSTTGATNQDVVATLVLNKTGSVLSSGWEEIPPTPLYERGSWTKTYTGNTTETVIFEDEEGMQGQAKVEITRIDKEAPVALAVVYTPSTAREVAVLLFTDTIVRPIE